MAGGPEHLTKACKESSELLMKLAALVMSRTCNEIELDEAFKVSERLNNFLVAVSEGDYRKSSEILQDMFKTSAVENIGMLSGAWMIVTAIMLENLSDIRKWTDNDSNDVIFDNDAFEKESQDLVADLLQSLKGQLKGDEDDTRGNEGPDR